MLGRNEFALRQGFAFGKTLVRRWAPPRLAGPPARGLSLSPGHRFRHPDPVHGGAHDTTGVASPHFPEGKAFREPFGI